MELKFINRESDFLIFETDAGDRARVVIDDALREAVKRVPQITSSGVTPKDVQSAIRSGKKPEQIAAEFNVPLEAVMPFAAPILDELRFVLQQALTTKVSHANRMQDFGELVSATYPNPEFEITKPADKWVLTAGSSLKWHFDPKTRVIDPISPAAQELAKSVASEREMIRVAPPSASATQPVTNVVTEPEDAPEEPAASVHDLVEELRARRAATQIKPASAKGRASLPSWDEIVLGTSSDVDSDQGDL
ncbi:MAG: hypothetical protein RIS08_682 [Actinomycetota bacterium]